MENIKKTIEKLNLKFPDWQEILKKNSDLSECYNEELKNKISELVMELRRYCKEKERSDSNIFDEFFDEQEIAKIIQEHVNRTLVYYNALRPIRKLSYQKPEYIKDMINDIFYNYILRFDPKIEERYKYIDNENENAICEIMKAMDRLTDYYVRHLLIQKAVADDFQNETGLKKEMCEYYAQLYEKHFQELKMNMILYGIESLHYKVREEEN